MLCQEMFPVTTQLASIKDGTVVGLENTALKKNIKWLIVDWSGKIDISKK